MKVGRKHIEAQDTIARSKEQAGLRRNERSKGNAGQNGKGAIDANDTVDISLAKQIADEGQQRAEKIALIKELVASGEYKPKGGEVAQSILGHLEEEIDYSRLVNGES